MSWRNGALLPRVALAAGLLISTPGPLAASPDSAECGAGGTAVTVEVRGLRSMDGNLTVTIYGDRPEDFLGPGRKLSRKRVPVDGATTLACLPVPGPGDYAIAVYHDEDDDHDFDRTLVGLPAEGYGFSNDAEALFGPPSYESARVTVPVEGLTLSIQMRY